jgi:ElaB/YqjD/DUF883 family membrane-anchored ribosome-binding protein
MFHHRSSAFDTDVSAIKGRLRALENALERIGQTAGQRTSAGISAAGENVSDAITAAVTEVVDRFRNGRRLAGDEASRLGNDIAKFGAKVGNDSLHRMASEIEHRPLVALAVAVGVGILIGMAGRRH